MKTLTIRHGFIVFIDDEDYARVSLRRWRVHFFKRGCRVESGGKYTTVTLADFVMGDFSCIFDHVDGNVFNNVKMNLRRATSAQNARNRVCYNSTGFKGVRANPDGKFEAQIKTGDKSFYLGRYTTVEDAALAYNEAAKKLFGEFARLNEIKSTLFAEGKDSINGIN